MACRVIGQESLVPEGGSRGGATLDRLSSLIDGRPVCTLLALLYPSARGEAAWAAAVDVQGVAAGGLVRPVGREAG